MAEPYSFNQNIDEETLEREYKIFTFTHAGVSLSLSRIEELIRTGEWVFNQIVKNNLIKYLEIYIPKYTCAFMHPLSNVLSSELYIGVDDFGNIIGIPYSNKLDLSFIEDTLSRILSSSLIEIDTEINLMDYISYEVIPISYNDNYDYDIWSEYLELKTDYISKMKKNREDKKKWTNKLHTYTRKLVELVNDRECRDNMIEYIINNYQDYVDNIEDVTPLIELLQSDNYINTNYEGRIIRILKTEPTNIIFWLTKWKDYIIDIHRETKPKSFTLSRVDPISYICNLEQMIPYWFQINENMKLCILKINFIKPDIEINISYKDLLGESKSCFRSECDSGPCCIPIN